jgi:DNA polymerase III subunit alpha
MNFEPKFIHLRVHTEYSLLEGAVPVKKLIGLCEKHAMPAVAVTDTNNMFAALEFSVLASGVGLQKSSARGPLWFCWPKMKKATAIF